MTDMSAAAHEVFCCLLANLRRLDVVRQRATCLCRSMTDGVIALRPALQDPIRQFQIVELFPVVKVGSFDLQFTNSALFMLLCVALTGLLLFGATARRELAPSRLQSIAEMSYEFVAKTVRDTAGEDGMKFFPLVFSLFIFILFANVLGLTPYAFTVTTHIIVTSALALLVFLTVIICGLYTHGLRWFRLFVPRGVPGYILPLIVFIEVLSFLSRPISHSVRLFANMLAGHITLKVFAGFVTMLSGLGFAGWLGALLPLSLTVALTALEFLVAFLQAYVFAILTSIYINDALHPGH